MPRRTGTTLHTGSPHADSAPAVHVAVRAEGLRKQYGTGDATVHALRGVDIDIPRAKFTAIMGPSGSGKSTLMHCIAGLDTPTGGRVVLADQELSEMNDTALTRARRDNIGFIFQQFNLLPTLTAEENITLPLSLAGRKPEQAWFDTVIAAVGLRERLGHRPAELSGGQQQRVAVARALVSQPEVIFADEPTGNLDSRSGAEVLALMRNCVDELGQTIVMVTHDATAASRADQVVFLADGRIVAVDEHPTLDGVLSVMSSITTAGVAPEIHEG